METHEAGFLEQCRGMTQVIPSSLQSEHPSKVVYSFFKKLSTFGGGSGTHTCTMLVHACM